MALDHVQATIAQGAQSSDVLVFFRSLADAMRLAIIQMIVLGDLRERDWPTGAVADERACLSLEAAPR